MTSNTEPISVLLLIDKFKKLNEFKSQNTLETLESHAKEKHEFKNLKYLNLDADLEEKLLTLIKDSEDKLYGIYYDLFEFFCD
jgi:hypothetical protein